MANEFKTTSELMREELYKRITSLYVSLRTNYPSLSDNRICNAICQQIGQKRTAAQIRNICISNGLIVKNARKQTSL